MPEGIRKVAYHARSTENPDEILLFGLAYDMEVENLTQLRERFTEEDGSGSGGWASSSSGLPSSFPVCSKTPSLSMNGGTDRFLIVHRPGSKPVQTRIAQLAV